MNPKELRQRADEAENDRRQIQSYIDVGYEYAIPWRKDANRGAIMKRLMDGTGPRAVANFAAHLSTSLIPPEGQFFELRAGDLVSFGSPEDIEQADRDNEYATKIIHSLLRSARIEIAMSEMCMDLALSTGAMFMRAGDKKRTLLETAAVPAYQLAIELGANNMHEAWFWKRNITGREIMANYPDADFPQSLKDKICKAPMQKYEVLQGTYWCSKDGIYKTSAIIENYELETTTQRASPWITPRYWAMPSFAWGIGPLLLALPDIRTLNKNVELILRAASLSLAPPMMVADDGILNPNNLVIGEHSLIRVSRTGGGMYGDPIKPLNIGGRVDLGQLVADDLKSSIQKTMLDYSLPPETGAVRSPTEIIKRDQQEQKITLGAFGRLQRECLEPIILRTIDIADQLKIPGISWQQHKPDYFLNKVKVTTPMARAVEQGDATNFFNFLQILQSVGGQELSNLMVDLEKQAPWIADMMGVPARIIRPADERADIKQQAMDAMQQQADMQQQMMQQQAAQEAQKNGAPPPTQVAPPPDEIPLDLLDAA